MVGFTKEDELDLKKLKDGAGPWSPEARRQWKTERPRTDTQSTPPSTPASGTAPVKPLTPVSGTAPVKPLTLPSDNDKLTKNGSDAGELGKRWRDTFEA